MSVTGPISDSTPLIRLANLARGLQEFVMITCRTLTHVFSHDLHYLLVQ